MKKVLSVVLAAAMAAFLGACGSGNTEPAANAAAAGGTAAEVAAGKEAASAGTAGEGSTEAGEPLSGEEFVKKGYRIAYILNVASSDIFQMADLLLDYICNTIYPEKVANKEPVKVLKIWRGPGVSPFGRCQETYLKYEQEGLIETLETLGPIDTANGEASMAQVVASALPKYPEGTVDAIWGCYDAYTRGAYVALMKANRKDIPVVSVDISNQDIKYMLDGNNVWRACSTVDFSTTGEQGIRILAMKLRGDETEEVYNLTPSLVLAEDLDAAIHHEEIIHSWKYNDRLSAIKGGNLT